MRNHIPLERTNQPYYVSVLSYNPIVKAISSCGVGVKILEYGGVERTPFLGEYNCHMLYSFNECSKVNKNDGRPSG